ISNVSAYSSYSTQATITYYENGIPQSSTGTISGTPVSSSLVPSNYFIIITNTQNVATPSPFQQMINISSSSPVWSYINTNQTSAFGQNVEFIYLNGTVIPSWLESYSSTHAIWWIKIGSIPANSAITIFMKIAPKSTNLFNGVTVGEAPQLSPTYGEYDNGANVFLNYFPGYSLSGWTTSGTSGQTSSAPAGSPFGTNAFYALNSLGSYLYTVANGQSENMIIEYYTYMNRLNDIFFLVNSSGAGQLARVGDGGGWYGIASTASWTSWNAPPDTGIWNDMWVLVGVVVHNGIAQMFLSTTLGNYGSELGQNPSNTYTVTNNGNYFGLVGDQQGNSYEYWNGIIIRAYPPNGIMPSVSIV
ncbi:MAG: hypothetical protein OH340_02495, partial [Candidatus Parvarchaeota archaeon]|nr:hypothetical protein [Candidatus Rehaiarchaeum fermentans]